MRPFDLGSIFSAATIFGALMAMLFETWFSVPFSAILGVLCGICAGLFKVIGSITRLFGKEMFWALLNDDDPSEDKLNKSEVLLRAFAILVLPFWVAAATTYIPVGLSKSYMAALGAIVGLWTYCSVQILASRSRKTIGAKAPIVFLCKLHYIETASGCCGSLGRRGKSGQIFIRCAEKCDFQLAARILSFPSCARPRGFLRCACRLRAAMCPCVFV